ncbi:hypothetical protein ACFSWE_04990 [Leucobacter albus]|uniref:Uncharacterized protein n=1 Tax=Leucobacter albus TaxID=272210 RepID=A0ABW3TNB5_9MICO
MSNELGNALRIALLGSVAAVVIAAVLCVVLGVVAWRVVPTGAARASTERSEERR